MKKLPLKFYRDGFQFEQVHRDGNICLLEKRKGNWLGWEVVKIQSHNGRSIAGHEIPPAEFMPSSNQWGAKGWSFTRLKDAIAKYQSLQECHSLGSPIA